MSFGNLLIECVRIQGENQLFYDMNLRWSVFQYHKSFIAVFIKFVVRTMLLMMTVFVQIIIYESIRYSFRDTCKWVQFFYQGWVVHFLTSDAPIQSFPWFMNCPFYKGVFKNNDEESVYKKYDNNDKNCYNDSNFISLLYKNFINFYLS